MARVDANGHRGAVAERPRQSARYVRPETDRHPFTIDDEMQAGDRTMEGPRLDCRRMACAFGHADDHVLWAKEADCSTLGTRRSSHLKDVAEGYPAMPHWQLDYVPAAYEGG